MEYTYTFAENDIKVLVAGLNELPFKHAASVMNKLVEQTRVQQANASKTSPSIGEDSPQPVSEPTEVVGEPV